MSGPSDVSARMSGGVFGDLDLDVGVRQRVPSRGLNADRLQLLRRRLAAEIVEADEFQRCGIDLVLLGSLALASALSMVAFWYS